MVGVLRNSFQFSAGRRWSMGRIKTILVKRATHRLLEKNREKLSSDFYKNREVIRTLLKVPSKKLTNVIAGYATRLMRKGVN